MSRKQGHYQPKPICSAANCYTPISVGQFFCAEHKFKPDNGGGAVKPGSIKPVSLKRLMAGR